MLQELIDSAVVTAVEADMTVMAAGKFTETTAPWGLDRVDQVNLPLDSTYTYDKKGAKDVTAYIIDSGPCSGASSLAGRVSEPPKPLPLLGQ